MKKFIIALVVGGTCCWISIPASAADASVTDGRNCTVDDRGAATWFGYFKGNRSVFAPLKGNASAKPIVKWRCFEVEADCNMWKAAQLVEFPDAISETFCRQGG